MILRQDPFKRYVVFKWVLTLGMGIATYFIINMLNRTKIKGTEHVEELPNKNVLFVSNHQTYFVDVIAIYHAFNAIKFKLRNTLSNPLYLFQPQLNHYYVAAEETMKVNWITRLFAYFGAVHVRRTWRDKDRSVRRPVRTTDIDSIGKALEDGWVITFPQGTTKKNAPGRKGVAHIIKQFQPIIIPVVVDGFNKAFRKKGIEPRRIGKKLKITFKAPLSINYDDKPEIIIKHIMEAIEQTSKAS